MSTKKDYRIHTVALSKKKQIKFYHNLPDTFGLNIDGAVTNWFVRAKSHTVESLKAYVASKGIDHEILTEEEYNNLKE